MAQPNGQKSGPGPPAAFFKLAKSLKKKFDKGTVQIPGTKPELETTIAQTKKYEANQVSLDDVYVKLHILEKSKLKQRVGEAAAKGTADEMERMAHVFSCGGEEIKSLELGEILTLAARPQCRVPRKDGVRVLALAGAGLGKTTAFLKKGPMEWMRGNIWTDVELLFAFPLRQPEVHLAKDLEDLLSLKRHGVHRQGDREDILEYVNENLDCLCIILDGLDEVDISKCSTFIQNLIKGDDLDGAQLIVTSRPSIPIIELAKEHPFNMRVEVLGFSEDDMACYVNKVLQPEDAAKVLEQVEASPSLAGYMQTPLNAANVCMLYRSGVTTIPTTMSSITSAIIRQVIDQNEKKKVKRADVAESLADVNPVLLDPVMELQAFAFKMLVDKVLVFEKRHFDECQLSDNARSLGVLVACDYDSPDATPQFVFTHLSIHEGFAARHVASSITQNDISWMVWTLGSLTGHLNTFWRFLAAELNAGGLDSLLCSLLVKPERETAAESPEPEAGRAERSFPEDASVVATAISGNETSGDIYVDRILQHLGSCFNIINPDSLGGPVSPEFLRRYVKAPCLPKVQDALTISNQQNDVPPRGKAAAEEAVQQDISELNYFFSASYSDLCQLADILSEHLDIANAERLAERLLKGVVHGSGTLAVRSAMPGASELRGRDFLRALLQFWKQRVPRANIQMLYRAIAEFDLLIAATCFPSLDHSHSAVGGCEAHKQLERVNLQSEEGKQLLLLCCHCYQEHSSYHGNTPAAPGFRCVLEWEKRLDFSDIHLTSADCRAIGLVLQSFNSVLSSLLLSGCHVYDTGYSQLASGIGYCTELSMLLLDKNKLSDQHADHIAMVIKNNQQKLKFLITSANHFTSAGNLAVHANTHLCRSLESLGVGGSECVDAIMNVTSVHRILHSCPQVSYFGLDDFSLDPMCMLQLQDLLSSHKLVTLIMHKIGLTPEHSPAICRILQQQQCQLTYLSLPGNALTDVFLVEAYAALAGCTYLKYVVLSGTRLTSACFSVLASLLYSWPYLQSLNITKNDFRADDKHALEFAQAVSSHSSLLAVWMPDRDWVCSELLSVLTAIAHDGLGIDFINAENQQDESAGDVSVGTG